MKKRYKNTITLTNRKLIQTWDLSQELLDQILNDYVDDFIYSKFTNDKHYRCMLTSMEVGIIWNLNISAQFYHVLRKFLKQQDLIYVERREP